MKFWEIKNKSKDVGELYVYGEISSDAWFGDEITPKGFQKELDELGSISELNIYINSPGGDVFAGQAMKAMLDRKEYKKNVFVDGMAASIATMFLLAADKVTIAENALIMIHNAWSVVVGNAKDMIETANLLSKIDDILSNGYQKLTGKSKEEVDNLMLNETWFDANEAISNGFAHEISKSIKVAACVKDNHLIINDINVDLSKFNNTEKIKELYPEKSEEAIDETPEIVQGESEPVDDKPDEEKEADEQVLSAQRKQFELLKLKLRR